MKDYLLCCDWGTSSFRLRLVNIFNQEILEEVLSPEGIATTFNAWKKVKDNDSVSKADFFRQQLNKHIISLSDKLAKALDHVPVIISGMASSSIGIEELPYTTLPFAANGSQAFLKYFEAQINFPHEVILISGVRSDQDVMRGEETQLIGLIDLVDLPNKIEQKAIYIFPGTHSKHIYVEEEVLIHFQTYMTGEVFQLLSQYSILKDSIESKTNTTISENELKGFKLGVKESGTANILNAIFKVRTNQLFGHLNKKENFYYLSGLLIGSELKDLILKKDWQLILCSGSNLFPFYNLALAELGLMPNTKTVPADLIDKAAVAGQIKIFKQVASELKSKKAF